MLKKLVLAVVISCLILVPTVAFAEQLADKLAFGVQYTPQFYGFSLKYQLDPERIIQPIIYLSAQGDGSASQSSKKMLAIRALYDLNNSGPYASYFGWGVGLNALEEVVGGITKSDTKYGLQGFVGWENASAQSPLRLNFELILGFIQEGDKDSYKAGFGLGLGAHYRF